MEGHHSQVAYSGEEAITAYLNTDFDLAFMDVMMPGKNGFQVTRQLKTDAETSGMKVLLLSSKNQDSDKFWGMKQGASDYITKPFAPASLIAAVRRFV